MTQKERYFASCVERGKDDQKLTQAEADAQLAFLAEQAGLEAMVNSPFLLQLYVKSYPELVARLAGQTDITRADLYTAFMQSWFKRQEEKLADSIIGDVPQGLRKSFAGFSQSLSFKMFSSETNKVTYDPNTAEEHSPWHDFFASEDPKVVEAQKGCPLHIVEMEGSMRSYSFIHQSFLEFFVAEKLWQALLNPALTLNDRQAMWGARCLMKGPKMPVVVDFLSDWIRTHDKKEQAKQALLELIAASKLPDCEPFGSELTKERLNPYYSASNAMTALCRGEVSFAQIVCEAPGTFKGIQIPYANLELAEASGVDFSEGDLSYVSLVGAKLSHAILDGCTLTGLDTQEYPMLKLDGCCEAMAYSPKGDRLAVATGEIITLYHSADGVRWHQSHVLGEHELGVICVSFSPDGKQLASSSSEESSCEDGIIRLWNALDGSPYGASPVLRGHEGGVTSVSFSPDGHQLASGSGDNTVRLWNALDGSPYGASPVLRGHERKVMSVSYSPDGHQLASGSWDNTVRLWNALDGSPYGASPVLRGHERRVNCVSYSPDGQQLASSSEDNTVRLWNALDGSAYGSSPVLRGHEGGVNSVSFSPDGKQLVSGSGGEIYEFNPADDTIRLWNVSDGSPYGPCPMIKWRREGYLNCVSYSPDGQQLASGGGYVEGEICLWNALDGSPYGASPVLSGHEKGVYCVSYSPDGQQLASGSRDETVRLWNALDGSPYGASPVLRGHESYVYCVSYSPDGHQLASGSFDRTICVWGMQCNGAYVQLYLIGAPQRLLRISDASLKSAKGLDESNQELFTQLGAHTVTLFKPAKAQQSEKPHVKALMPSSGMFAYEERALAPGVPPIVELVREEEREPEAEASRCGGCGIA